MGARARSPFLHLSRGRSSSWWRGRQRTASRVDGDEVRRARRDGAEVGHARDQACAAGRVDAGCARHGCADDIAGGATVADWTASSVASASVIVLASAPITVGRGLHVGCEHLERNWGDVVAGVLAGCGAHADAQAGGGVRRIGLERGGAGDLLEGHRHVVPVGAVACRAGCAGRPRRVIGAGVRSAGDGRWEFGRVSLPVDRYQDDDPGWAVSCDPAVAVAREPGSSLDALVGATRMFDLRGAAPAPPTSLPWDVRS